MRTIKYRDLLWSCAYRIGLDPAKDFLQDQADSLASYINGWLRRLYDSQDWPEWTKIIGFEVTERNIVPYLHHLDTITGAGGQIEIIGRVFNVYPVDPSTTTNTFEIPFRLTDEGIFVGAAHGGHVWVKYIPACPRVSSTPWRSDITYGIGDVVYEPRIGECFRSKLSNNINHDPAGEFVNPNPPPFPEPPGPPPSLPPPSPPPSSTLIEIVQERTPDNPGMPERNQIYTIDFDSFKSSQPSPGIFHIPDPPALNDEFYIDIFDDTGLLGEAGPISANGSDTVEMIMAALAADLDTDLGGTFAVTSGLRSVIVEHNSVFYSGHTYYKPALGFPYFFPIPIVTQSYVPSVAGTPGQPQKTVVTMTEDQAYTGATYRMSFRGPDGLEHSVEYVAQTGDSTAQILAGLTAAIEAARVYDEYFNELSPTIDPDQLTMGIDSRDIVSIDMEINGPGSPWWQIELIPETLANPIIRGEVADVYREEGQTDRADAEEKKVESETAMAAARFTTPQFLPLTDQQKPKSRYSIR